MKLWPSTARWPALLLLALFAGIVLAACQANPEIPWATVEATTEGGTPIAEETSGPTQTPLAMATASVTPRPAPTLKGQSIEFWHPWQGDLAKRADAAAAEFNRTNEWGLLVKARPFYSNGALADAVAAGLKDNSQGLPHVVVAPSDQLAAWAAMDGAVITLDELLNEPQYGFSEAEKSDFIPAFWAQDQVGGRQIGIPALRTARVMFYNEGWAKDLGFAGPPKTPAEFRAQACAAAQKNNTGGAEKFGTGGWLIDNEALTTLSWLTVFGAQPIPTVEGSAYTFEGKEAEEALAFLRGMLDDGCAWLGRNPEPYEYFSRRMALFYSGTLTDIAAQARWQEKSKSSDHWKILPFLNKEGKHLVYSNGYSYAVFQASPDAELAAWLFVRWLEKPAVSAKFIQALPSLPVSSAQAAQLKDAQAVFPWDMILPLSQAVRPAPGLASWLEAHRVVEDASWQIFHSTAEEVPLILPSLDEALKSIITKK